MKASALESLPSPDSSSVYQKWQDFVSLGTRFVGSTGEATAAAFIEKEISQLGFEIHSHEFELETFNTDPTIKFQLTQPQADAFPCHIMLGSTPTGSTGIEGHLQYVGKQGVIGLLEWEKYAIETEEGKPIGYVLGRPDGDAMPQPLGQESLALPHFVIGKDELEVIHDLRLSSSEVTCRAVFEAVETPMVGRNILVQIPGSGSGVSTVVSAHYDSMYSTQGANDNAAGVVALLSLARWLADAPPTRNVTLAFFTGEEWGLAGSRAYVADLGRDRLQEQIQLLINLDGIAEGEGLQAWVSSEALETNIRHAIANADSDLEMPEFRVPAPPGSDHTPFDDIGIPVCMFTRGDITHWHQPSDLPREEALPGILSMIELAGFLIRSLS